MQFRGKGKARHFFGKLSQPQPSVGLPCFMDSVLLPGKAGVESEISALQPPEGGGHLLLPIATAYSLAATDCPPRPIQCLAGRIG